jgi:hypothetical protein
MIISNSLAENPLIFRSAKRLARLVDSTHLS